MVREPGVWLLPGRGSLGHTARVENPLGHAGSESALQDSVPPLSSMGSQRRPQGCLGAGQNQCKARPGGTHVLPVVVGRSLRHMVYPAPFWTCHSHGSELHIPVLRSAHFLVSEEMVPGVSIPTHPGSGLGLPALGCGRKRPSWLGALGSSGGVARDSGLREAAGASPQLFHKTQVPGLRAVRPQHAIQGCMLD